MRCANGSPPTLGLAAALRSSERTAAIRSIAGAPVVRLRGCGRPARRITYRSCGGGARPVDEALDFVATEGFFWINA
jgi:hypothetical protein